MWFETGSTRNLPKLNGIRPKGCELDLILASIVSKWYRIDPKPHPPGLNRIETERHPIGIIPKINGAEWLTIGTRAKPCVSGKQPNGTGALLNVTRAKPNVLAGHPNVLAGHPNGTQRHPIGIGKTPRSTSRMPIGINPMTCELGASPDDNAVITKISRHCEGRRPAAIQMK